MFYTLLFAYFRFLVIQFSRYLFCQISLTGGLKWTRTTDLTLIRRAL